MQLPSRVQNLKPASQALILYPWKRIHDKLFHSSFKGNLKESRRRELLLGVDHRSPTAHSFSAKEEALFITYRPRFYRTCSANLASLPSPRLTEYFSEQQLSIWKVLQKVFLKKLFYQDLFF